ncbi:hypothetical protein GUJ93_ZPchr0012g20621 [Zizania palustris]|uniref:Uncharacterized protein n=1 Tax=Zizania palustris TaxID=103762 RepID=A0A8J5WRC1_ZIZPA|nr:hypothetical protein GUJ93_ZPchr0012g20621 [Zizania palustris]
MIKNSDALTPVFSATPPLLLRSPLTIAGSLLRPRRPHHRDRQNLLDLGHPSAIDEPRRIAIADKDPNDFAAPLVAGHAPSTSDHRKGTLVFPSLPSLRF